MSFGWENACRRELLDAATSLSKYAHAHSLASVFSLRNCRMPQLPEKKKSATTKCEEFTFEGALVLAGMSNVCKDNKYLCHRLACASLKRNMAFELCTNFHSQTVHECKNVRQWRAVRTFREAASAQCFDFFALSALKHHHKIINTKFACIWAGARTPFRILLCNLNHFVVFRRSLCTQKCQS